MTLMLGGVPDWVLRGLVRIGLFREEPPAPVLHPPPVHLGPFVPMATIQDVANAGALFSARLHWGKA